MTATRLRWPRTSAAAGDSVLFDDMTTASVVETRDERAVTSLLDAVDFLNTKLGTDRTQWRWGTLHTLRFASLVSLWDSLSIPPIGDSTFPDGFPRHGDGFNIDVAEPDSLPANLSDATFTYSEGPTQRFVIDLDPSGPTPFNVLPGGEVWDNASPHFATRRSSGAATRTTPCGFRTTTSPRTPRSAIRTRRRRSVFARRAEAAQEDRHGSGRGAEESVDRAACRADDVEGDVVADDSRDGPVLGGTNLGHDGAHRLVVGEDVGTEPVDAALASGVGQRGRQETPEAPALDVVHDGDGGLGDRRLVAQTDEPGHAQAHLALEIGRLARATIATWS